jgi:formate dehydrogenase major subunit
MTNSISEIGDAAAILAVGTNTTSGHPIVGQQVRAAVRKGSKLIVINPKEIDLCRIADHFLQHKPGTDVTLLMGMMRVIWDKGLYDKSFIEARCENFEAFEKSLAEFDLDFVENITGVPQEKIIEAALCYATEKPASIIYCMGITQHVQGTDNVLATANLAMLTGNIGKPSSGVNPLRGQNNVQGACDMGSLPNVYPGYQAVSLSDNKAKFESAWGCELSDSPGLTHTEIFDAVHSGKINALYLVGENPYLSEANASHAIEAMKKADFLVVQDIFLSETAELAHVVLPAASFAEEDGTFTNTERRVQRLHKVIEPVGSAKPDWWITCQIAKRLNGKGFDFSSPMEVMEEITSLAPSYGGISYERLERGGLQWPCPSEEHPGTQILHTEQFATDTGKGKFMPLTYRRSAEEPDEEYPLLLTTDRSLYHFHGTMTRRVYGLNVLEKEERLKIHPDDASGLGIKDGEIVRVVSRRGGVDAKVKVTDQCPRGTVSMSFHFAETPTNVLTCSELDPVAKTPATKVCAVRIERSKS